MTAHEAVETLQSPDSTPFYDDAWRQIYAVALLKCKAQSRCRCPDDTDCKHHILDLAQEVCLSVHKNLHTIRNPDEFINKVAKNLVTDEIRQRTRKKRGANAVHISYTECTNAEDEVEDAQSLHSVEACQTPRPLVGFESDLQSLVRTGHLTELEMKMALQRYDAEESLDELAARFGLTKSSAHRKLRDIVSVLRSVF